MGMKKTYDAPSNIRRSIKNLSTDEKSAISQKLNPAQFKKPTLTNHFIKANTEIDFFTSEAKKAFIHL